MTDQIRLSLGCDKPTKDVRTALGRAAYHIHEWKRDTHRAARKTKAGYLHMLLPVQDDDSLHETFKAIARIVNEHGVYCCDFAFGEWGEKTHRSYL
jgi:hypothetical protein